MFQVGEYVIYKRDVCTIKQIKKNFSNNKDYYVLIPLDDESLVIEIPVENTSIRNLMSKKEVEDLIKEIPKIPVIKSDNKIIENEYKHLLQTEQVKDLITIIKTTYLRNKERLEHKKKIGDRDNYYFQMAEKYLYNEVATVLNLSFDEAKEYVVSSVLEMEKN